MKIKGLLFTRLDEEYEFFTQAQRSIGTADISIEEEEKLIKAYEERILEDSLKGLYDRYPTFCKMHIKNQELISKEMEESFRYFFAYINTADQVYENMMKYLNTTTISEKYKFIIPQYGLLIRLANQIGAMVLDGYPDGAFRIWRSFYEYAVVTLLFIKERENDDLQKKYFDHFHRSKRKKSESLQKHYKDLKFPPLEDEFLAELKKRVEEFDNTYGKDFLDNDYGWCQGIFNFSRKVTLRDIEEYVGINRMRPFYIWASGYTHPGFESMLDFFEEEDQKIVLNKINRPTLRKCSFLDPMQFTIGLFDDVNQEFLKVYSADGEYEINMLMFRRVFEAMLQTF